MINSDKVRKTRTILSERKCPDVYGDAHPKALLRTIYENGDFLVPLATEHIISSGQFSPECLLQIFRLAAKYESNPTRFSNSLQGKILISAFYEPSTRTRLSFESAWHRLGGDIMSITDRSTTGMAKGESSSDVAEMFNNYGDCVVLRDSRENTLYEMMKSLRIPIINAGNGFDEHPTQAMADLYTLFKWRPELILKDLPKEKKIHFGVIGRPNKMRTVRSLLQILAHFPHMQKKVTIIHDCPIGDLFDPHQRESLEEAGLNISTSTSLSQELPDLDVIYINSIAWGEGDYQTFGSQLRLNSHSPFKKDAIVLHPLARGEELSTDLDETNRNWYFSQARGAVFVRMALLTCMVKRTSLVLDVV